MPASIRGQPIVRNRVADSRRDRLFVPTRARLRGPQTRRFSATAPALVVSGLLQTLGQRALTASFRFLLLAVFFLSLASSDAHAQVRLDLPVESDVLVDTVAFRTGEWFRTSTPFLAGSVRLYAGTRWLSAAQFEVRSADSVRVTDSAVDDGIVIVRYRRNPFTVTPRRAISGIIAAPHEDSISHFAPLDDVRAPSRSNDPFGNSNLQRSGSISRGVIAGNRQDATIESGLRLQLAGEVVDGVTLRAVLSDENTPILPEGTTQRIDEFDKVFIELAARNGAAQLGDFELRLDGSTFGAFSRKLQGVNVTGQFGQNAVTSEQPVAGSGMVAAATSRGTYRSQVLNIEDGAQGPYRLEGEQGERFIILIPASEIVYLDGERMERGESNDYVVDYSTAEITFTPNQLMSRDKRVVVEFQYTTNQFTRTLVATEAQSTFWSRPDGTARASLNVSFIRESDSRQFVDEFGLTPSDSLLIAQAGDNPASRSGAEEVSYNPEALFVQYVREALPIPEGPVDTIFVAISGPVSDTTKVYRVQFSSVGTGNGHYARVGRNLNGIVYEYVGAGSGDYEPIRQLPIPRQQRLFDIAARAELVRGLEVFGEFAQSNNDENRLSDLDADDDVGFGGIAGIRLKPKTIAGFGGRDLRVSASAERRTRESTFRTFNRSRSVEFGREWNLSNLQTTSTGALASGTETIDVAEVAFAIPGAAVIDGEFGRLELGDHFASQRMVASARNDPSADSSGAIYSYTIENISSDDLLLNRDGRWLRQMAVAKTRRFADIVSPQLEISAEKRLQRVGESDSLAQESFQFTDVRPGVGLHFVASSVFAEVQFRNEREALEGKLINGSRSITGQTRIVLRPAGSFRSSATIGYRVRRYSDIIASSFGRPDQESLVMSISGDWRPLDRAIVTSWLYEAQTERTPRLQEIYVRTGAEFGDYVWNDDNGDGVPQIEEFVYETTPNEGVYSRSFVPSDSLFSAVAVQARGRIDFDPARIGLGDGLVAQGLKHVFLSTIVEVSEKSRDPQLANIYLLRQRYFRNENTLNGRTLFRQSVKLFRSNSAFGIDGSFTRSRGLSDLSASAERRITQIGSIDVRARVSDRVGANLSTATERSFVFSENLTTRQFDLRTTRISPSLSWSPRKNASVRITVEYADKTDRLAARSAKLLKVPVEFRLQKIRRFQILSRVETASVTADGDAAGLASFELTDGRGIGRSYLWNVTGEYFVNQYLRASVTYDGRSPSNAPTLHTFRMQLSASF